MRCYRWLATQLKGFKKTAPKQLYRTFVETGGVIEIQAQRRSSCVWTGGATIPSCAKRTTRTDGQRVPWLQNLPVTFEYS